MPALPTPPEGGVWRIHALVISLPRSPVRLSVRRPACSRVQAGTCFQNRHVLKIKFGLHAGSMYVRVRTCPTPILRKVGAVEGGTRYSAPRPKLFPKQPIRLARSLRADDQGRTWQVPAIPRPSGLSVPPRTKPRSEPRLAILVSRPRPPLSGCIDETTRTGRTGHNSRHPSCHPPYLCGMHIWSMHVVM